MVKARMPPSKHDPNLCAITYVAVFIPSRGVCLDTFNSLANRAVCSREALPLNAVSNSCGLLEEGKGTYDPLRLRRKADSLEGASVNLLGAVCLAGIGIDHSRSSLDKPNEI
jgi:hypothetical protein